MAVDFSQILELTIDKFDLTAKAIAETGGINPNTISNFRTDKSDMKVETLSRLLEALPMEAKMYFAGLLSQQLMSGQITITYAPGDRPERSKRRKTPSPKKSAVKNSARNDALLPQ